MKTIVEALNGLTTKLGGVSSSPETIVGALHDVYGALGGSSPVSDTIADAVDEVTTVASSGGGGDSLITFETNDWEAVNKNVTGTLSSGISLGTISNFAYMNYGNEAVLTIGETEINLPLIERGLYGDETSGYAVMINPETGELILTNQNITTSATYAVKLSFSMVTPIVSDEFIEVFTPDDIPKTIYNKDTYITFNVTWTGIGTPYVSINGTMLNVSMMGVEEVFAGNTKINGAMFHTTTYRLLIPLQAIGYEIQITWVNSGATAIVTTSGINGTVSNKNTLTFTPEYKMHGTVNVQFAET